MPIMQSIETCVSRCWSSILTEYQDNVNPFCECSYIKSLKIHFEFQPNDLEKPAFITTKSILCCPWIVNCYTQGLADHFKIRLQKPKKTLQLEKALKERSLDISDFFHEFVTLLIF